MELEEAKSTLKSMLIDIGDTRPMFKKDSYSNSFDVRYKEMEPFLMRLEQAYNDAEDKEAFLTELGAAPAFAAKSSLDAIKKKHLRETQLMEYNFTMVTFVLPVILKYKADYVEPLTDSIVLKWAETFPKYKIQKATYEDINSGFRRKWCYITTAVCESLGKGDDCYELNVLRNYRDGYLASQDDGEAIIRLYYDIAPTIVHRIDRCSNAAEIYNDIYREYLSPCIRLIEENKLSECKDAYFRMVNELRGRFAVPQSPSFSNSGSEN